MRQEIENWWRQAIADLDSAKDLLKTGHFYFASFACQQAMEKGLKTFALIRQKNLPMGHSLVYLAKELKVPPAIFQKIVRLNTEYTTTRYPDAANAAPVDIYTKEISEEHFKYATDVIQWLKKQIKK